MNKHYVSGAYVAALFAASGCNYNHDTSYGAVTRDAGVNAPSGIPATGIKSGSIGSVEQIPSPGATTGKAGVTSLSQPVEPLKFYNEISPSRIPIAVVAGENQMDFQGAVRLITGNIANAGYEVTDTQPFITISLHNAKIDKFDQFGNYFISQGRVEVTVHRCPEDYYITANGVNRLLANTILKAKGVRKLGREEADDSTIAMLGEAAAKWVDAVCKRELFEVSAVRVNLDMDFLRSAYAGIFNRNDSFEHCVSGMLRQIAATRGILYCRETGRTEKFLTLEILYSRKTFPNGPIAQSSSTDILFKFRNLKDRTNEVMHYMMR